MADVPAAIADDPAYNNGLGATQRKDPWWQEWLGVVVGLGILGGYACWCAFQGVRYSHFGSYLSPFYSPGFLELNHVPRFVPVSVIPLAIIGLFRATCYYYRKAYYRAFFADPAGCAVGEARKSYCGETKFPFLVQNMHRYFMYLATIALLFLWIDMVHSFFWQQGAATVFSVRVGSLVMLVNVVLLTGYTFGCHSIRHLVGGKSNCMSCSSFQLSTWKTATKFNVNHQHWAWLSLTSVCLTDLYIRLVAMGVLVDGKLI
jgi:hypothetical protein